MATTTKTETLDDFTGEAGATTVEFFHQGEQYSIDLKGGTLANFRKMIEAQDAKFAPFVAKARKVTAKTRTARKGKGKSGQASQAAVIRAWAVANGVEVGTRGRLAPTVIEQYNAAHAG